MSKVALNLVLDGLAKAGSDQGKGVGGGVFFNPKWTRPHLIIMTGRNLGG